jgi:hypothetical protein
VDYQDHVAAQPNYMPGEIAPRTGVYVVIHQRHRLSHLALAEEGEVFPVCCKCGNYVRFKLHMRTQFLNADRDLAGKTRPGRRRRAA